MGVRLESLSKAYGERFTLGPLSLSIDTGVVCIVGPNGAGKTTLFELMAGVVTPTSGSVTVTALRPGLGFLPQTFRLPPRATCNQFLEYVAWLHGVPKAARSERAQQLLEAVGLIDRADRPLGELSGGMAKRIGIAQTLVHDPGLVLLDEPTSGLDPVQRVEVRELVARLSGQRVVLVSTHLVEDIRGLADRVLVLNEGRLLYDGDVGTLEGLADPDAPGDSALERALSGLILGARR